MINLTHSNVLKVTCTWDLCFFITKENLAAMSSSAPAESGVLYTSSCHISYRCCPSFVTWSIYAFKKNLCMKYFVTWSIYAFFLSHTGATAPALTSEALFSDEIPALSILAMTFFFLSGFSVIDKLSCHILWRSFPARGREAEHTHIIWHRRSTTPIESISTCECSKPTHEFKHNCFYFFELL